MGFATAGIDLDVWTDDAQRMVGKLNTYAEISPGRVGVHIIARAKPFKQTICKTEALTAEAYCTGRYFTFSGVPVEGAPKTVEARPAEIAEVVAGIGAVDDAAKSALRRSRDVAAGQSAGSSDEGASAGVVRLKRGKPYLQQFRDGEAKQAVKKPLTQSSKLDGIQFEELGGGEPLNMEKFKAALWWLADGWLTAEGNWKMVCLICANEAMRNGGGQLDVKQALWEALDERSRDVDGYDVADNRAHFERFMGDYGKVQPPILGGSLYQEAERQGWTWTPTPSEEDVATVGGSGGAGKAGWGVSAGASGVHRKGVKPLKGRSSYAQAHNLLIALPFRFSYNELHDQCFYDGEPVSDALLGRLREYCIEVSEDHRDPTLKTVREAAEALCDTNRFDPEKDWLNGLVWDRVPRLDTWLTVYCGVEDTPLARAVGRKFIIGKVLRALYPGCLHDWALVLEGPQGCGKTSVARILAGSPDRILDAPIMHEKPQVQQEMLRGRTVQEIAEMSDMKRADTNTIKAYMSRTHDRARGAYAHSPRDQPRRCVYIGTTNDAKYLPDEDNRRFDPLKVGVIDLNALQRDRDQLHAEAKAAADKGEDAVVPRNLWAAAAKEQKKRRIEDPWEDVLGDAIRSQIALNAAHARDQKKLPSRLIREIMHKARRVWFISSAAILGDILRIEPAQQHGAAGKRARVVMGRLGWEPERPKVDGWPTRGFLYDPAAKGLSAGEWDRYGDALDDEGDEALASSDELTPESNNQDESSGVEARAESEEAQTLDMEGVTFEDEDDGGGGDDEGSYSEEGGPAWWRRQ
jgi:predicted P-loop ATPase